MVSSNIIEAFSIVVNEDIKIDNNGNATSKKKYTFYNVSDQKLTVKDFFWIEEIPTGTSEFFLIKKDGSKERLHPTLYEKCPCCDGKGKRQNQKCIGCNGTGQVEKPSHINVPIIDIEKIIAPRDLVEASIEYIWKNFAYKLGKNWIFRYLFKNPLKKVELNLKIELPTASETWLSRLNKLYKELKVDFDTRKLTQSGNILEGQFSDIFVLINGIYYYGSKEWVDKWWVGWIKIIILGIVSIIIFELFLRNIIL